MPTRPRSSPSSEPAAVAAPPSPATSPAKASASPSSPAARTASARLERAEANLVFQVISKRYEKGSIILTSNKTFSKAHMFRRTYARRRRIFTGSSRIADAA